MSWPKGKPRPPGAGRQKGTPNRMTRDVREALVEAFERAGGVDFLLGVAQSDPPTFCRMLARLVPNEIAARLEPEIRLRIIDHSQWASTGGHPGPDSGRPLGDLDASTSPIDLRPAPRDLAPVIEYVASSVHVPVSPAGTSPVPVEAKPPTAPIVIARPWEQIGGRLHDSADFD